MSLIKRRKKSFIKEKRKDKKDLLKRLKKSYITRARYFIVYSSEQLDIVCKYLDKHKIKYYLDKYNIFFID